jgi:hypothetical protein
MPCAYQQLYWACFDWQWVDRRSRPTAAAGWYHGWTDDWRQLIEVVPKKTLERDSTLRWDWSWEQRVSLNRFWQVEWRLAREERVQTLLGLGQFF